MMKYLIGILVLSSLLSCTQDVNSWQTLAGKTMGTTYHVEYASDHNLQPAIDSLLAEVNQSVSTYISSSTISRFNETGTLEIVVGPDGRPVDVLDRHFLTNLEEAFRVYKISNGYFDPTVGPLVEAWGFGSRGHQSMAIDSSRIDSLLSLVGMEGIALQSSDRGITVHAVKSGMQLDFSALAKGYAVDLVLELLRGSGARNVFVEIGGEVRVSGVSPRGDAWVLGISTPEESADIVSISARIKLQDAAMATSGNYRNVYVLNGRKVWHTINPMTGYPEENNLLSVTIVHPECITADALATACMALGADSAIALIQSIPEAEGYFIYRDVQDNISTFATDQLAEDILPQ